MEPRVVRAGNRGPFTLDGTRTYLIGARQVAVIDPGPEVEDHLRALASSLANAGEIRILLTHHHSDHAGGASALATRLDAQVLAPPSYRPGPSESDALLTLKEGDVVPTDAGAIEVFEVPGHTKDHLAFHWVEANALFVGDLLLGRGNTTWVGEYPDSVADYLESLRKVRELAPRVLYPTHGPPISNPLVALESFEGHRLARIEEVREARLTNPDASPEELARIIYGKELPDPVAKAAKKSAEAIVHFLDGWDEEREAEGF